MKKQLIFFTVLIVGFVLYNLFFQTDNDKINTIINIIYASLLFGYISLLAFTALKKMNK